MTEETKKEEVVEEVQTNNVEVSEKEVEKQEEIQTERTEQRKYRDNREPRKDFRRDNKRDSGRDFRDRGDRDDYRFRKMRRKICLLCKERNYVLDYKDEETIKRFVNEKGKILPRRATGTCAKHQREIATVIKRARHIAVLPYTTD